MTLKKIKKISLSVVSFLFLQTRTVFAGDFSLEIDWPDSPAGAVLTEESTLAELVIYFFEWGVAIAVVFVFGTLVYASFKYIISSGDPQKLSGAKSRIQSAFFGLLVLLGSWLLITILNPELAVISEVGVSGALYDEAYRMDAFEEKEPCDYAIITYAIRGLEDNIRHTMIETGDITTLTQRQRDDERDLSMDPYFGVACKDGGEIEEDEDEEVVRFIEARVVSDHERLTPVCDIGCAQNPGEECDPEIFIDREFNMPKYCYDYRRFWHPGSPRFPGYETTGSVKYISQKKHTTELTCLEGDITLDDQQGCALNLYAGRFAGRCGDMIGSPGIIGSSPSEGWDREVNCMEVIARKTETEPPKYDLTVINDWPEEDPQNPQIEVIEDGSLHEDKKVEKGEKERFYRIPFRTKMVVKASLERDDSGFAILTDNNQVGRLCDSRADLFDATVVECEFELIQNLKITLEKEEEN